MINNTSCRSELRRVPSSFRYWQTLVDKEILSNSEVRTLLTKAASDLGPHGYTAPYEGSMGFILDDLLPKFPEDGGD